MYFKFFCLVLPKYNLICACEKYFMHVNREVVVMLVCIEMNHWNARAV